MSASARRLILVWMFFLLRGAEAAMILPLWGGFDEWLHAGYAAYLSRTGSIPVQGTPSIPEDIARSLALMPADAYDRGQPTYSEFWKSPESRREEVLAGLRGIALDPSSPFVLGSWQAQHPPVFYAVLSPVWKLLEGTPLRSGVLALRFLGVLIASLALFPMFNLLRDHFTERESILALALFGAFPATFILFGHVTNDVLALPLMTFAVLIAVRLFSGEPGIRLWILGGAVLGLGIVTKIYVLVCVPAYLAAGFRQIGRFPDRKRRAVLGLALCAAAACAISAPWFHHNLRTYGTWNATVHAVVAREAGWADKFAAAKEVDWKSFAASNLIGLLWAGNWSFVPLPGAAYRWFGYALILVILALPPALARMKKEEEDWTGAAFLLLFPAFFSAAMAAHQVQNVLAGNFDTMGGWYWSALFPCNAAIAAFSLRFLLRNFFETGLRALVLGAWALSLWGGLAVLLPHYTGMPPGRGLAESLRRISQLNGLPVRAVPGVLAAEAACLAGILLYSRREVRL
ncbi:MAG: hypothetical protein A2902_04930 [Elusimicrobia bacterium RIFCSPLOWO2_01_FULL_64_13]|nr:MAG: hypothetical protein A2902_04930 [Elusimicrobia bacterium RIFCSPLOWO2_01_FULL_64_13]